MQLVSTPNSSRIYIFDVLKFLGAIGIALLHFNWKIIPQGYLFVEMFFIISGFLLYKNITNYAQKDLKSILVKRLYSFYLLYLFVLIGQISINKFPPFANFLSALFFLGDIGLGERFNYGALWFLGVYIYCFMFYIIMLRTFNREHFVFLVGIIVFTILCAIYTFSPGHALNRTYEITIGPFQFGVLRGFVGIGIGILFGNTVFCEKNFSAQLSSIFSISLLGLFLFYLFHSATPAYDFINYLVICGLLKTLSSKGFLSTVLNYIGKKFHYICSLSLPIYIFHCMVIDILKKLNYSTQDYPPLLYLFWVVLLSVVMERLQRGLILIYRQIKIRL